MLALKRLSPSRDAYVTDAVTSAPSLLEVRQVQEWCNGNSAYKSQFITAKDSLNIHQQRPGELHYDKDIKHSKAIKKRMGWNANNSTH